MYLNTEDEIVETRTWSSGTEIVESLAPTNPAALSVSGPVNRYTVAFRLSVEMVIRSNGWSIV